MFKLDHMPDIPHLNGLVIKEVPPRVYEISKEQIKEVFLSKSAKSSPGPSQTRYGHLALVNDAAPDWFHSLITEELNSTDAPEHWHNVTCIPLYKSNKLGSV